MKHFFFLIIITAIAIANSESLQAQGLPSYTKQVDQLIFGNDTIPVLELKEIPIISRKFIDAVDEYKFNQLKREVMIVYPYAQKSMEMIRIVQENEADMHKNKEKKEYRKDLENKLEGEFKAELENLTTTQGKILVEWIERQSGKTMYQIIKENKNAFSAFTWSFTAARFGYNLKQPYNPAENSDLELILHSIED